MMASPTRFDDETFQAHVHAQRRKWDELRAQAEADFDAGYAVVYCDDGGVVHGPRTMAEWLRVTQRDRRWLGQWWRGER